MSCAARNAGGFARPGAHRYPALHVRGLRARRRPAARSPWASWAPPPLGGACRHPRPDAPGHRSLEAHSRGDPSMTASETTPAPQDPAKRVMIFDTTLRDGEQSPGIAAQHAREGRDRPAARPPRRGRDRGRLPDQLARRFRGDPRGRRRDPRGSIVAGLARANERDVDRGRRGRARRASTRASTRSSPPSDIHLTVQAEDGRARRCSPPPWTRSASLDPCVDDVEFSLRGRHPHRLGLPGRGRRARPIEAGATTINIPDTVGYAMPDRVRRRLIAPLRRACPALATSSVASTATTTWAWPSPTPWPA